MALILAILAVTGQAQAVVSIHATDLGGPGQKVQITYDASGETQAVRAFALDITVSNGVILEVSNFKIGPSMAHDPGYGIFPANFSRHITVEPDGTVADWAVAGYSPVTDANDPNALGGIGTDGITIEMGSLYDGDANRPHVGGVLCSLTLSECAELSVTVNAARGGVVLEGGAAAEVDLTAATEVPICDEGCYPRGCPDYGDWVMLGMPSCWCPVPSSPGYQCDGDLDGEDSGVPLRYRVFIGDLAVVVGNWRKKADDPTLDPCADCDHADSGPPFRYRVFTGDLGCIIRNWKKKAADLPGDCPRCG